VASLQVPTSSSRSSIARSDAGAIVVGTLAKLLLMLSVVGAVGYDSISIAGAQIGAQQDAQEAALRANTVLAGRGTPEMAYAAAASYAKDHGDTLVASGFKIGTRHAVTVELRREAHTIVAGFVPRVKQYTVAVATATFQDPV
jgi:hypothetical protein